MTLKKVMEGCTLLMGISMRESSIEIWYMELALSSRTKPKKEEYGNTGDSRNSYDPDVLFLYHLL